MRPARLTAFTGGGFGFGGGGRGGRGGANAPPPLPLSSLQKRSGRALRADARRFRPTRAVNEPYWHRKGEEGRYTFDADAPFGLPMRPTPFYVQVTLALPGGEEVIQGLPVQHRYEGDIFSGEKRSELLVVPAFSVRVTPQVAIVPESAIRSTVPARPSTAAGRAGAAGAAGAARTGRGAAAPQPATSARRAARRRPSVRFASPC